MTEGSRLNPKREDGIHLQEIGWEEMLAMYVRHGDNVPYGVPTYYAMDRHGRVMVYPRTYILEMK